jgi:hypothetical protein
MTDKSVDISNESVAIADGPLKKASASAAMARITFEEVVTALPAEVRPATANVRFPLSRFYFCTATFSIDKG